MALEGRGERTRDGVSLALVCLSQSERRQRVSQCLLELTLDRCARRRLRQRVDAGGLEYACFSPLGSRVFASGALKKQATQRLGPQTQRDVAHPHCLRSTGAERR